MLFLIRQPQHHLDGDLDAPPSSGVDAPFAARGHERAEGQVGRLDAPRLLQRLGVLAQPRLARLARLRRPAYGPYELPASLAPGQVCELELELLVGAGEKVGARALSSAVFHHGLPGALGEGRRVPLARGVAKAFGLTDKQLDKSAKNWK